MHFYEVHGARLTSHGSILFVCVDESLAAEARDWLQPLGYDVVEVPNGIRALSLLSESPDSILLIVTQLNMPIIHGLELAESARVWRPGIAVVYIRDSSFYEPIQAGPDDIFIEGPCTLADLQDRIAFPARSIADAGSVSKPSPAA